MRVAAWPSKLGAAARAVAAADPSRIEEAARELGEDWIAAALEYEGELAERLGDTERVIAWATDAMAQGIGPAARHQQGFLLAVLAHWGPAGLARCNGMWTFAVLDT